jgi:hypothetical protein
MMSDKPNVEQADRLNIEQAIRKAVVQVFQKEGYSVVEATPQPEEGRRFDPDAVMTNGQDLIVLEVKHLGTRPLGYDNIAQIISAAQAMQAQHKQRSVSPLIVGSFGLSGGVRDIAEKNGVKLFRLGEDWSPLRPLEGLGALQEIIVKW